MTYFYDKSQKTFLVEGIHKIPANTIAVSDGDYQTLIDGRANGCEIIVSKNNKLSLTTPKPSPAHIWDGSKWVISSEKQTAYISQRKETLLTALANRADQLKNGLLVGYPQTEIESFYRQEKEALAWQLDHKTDAPMLTQIARLRGVPFEMLVEKVIEKSNQFAVAIGIIIGQRQKFEDRLLAATDIQQLDELEQEINEWQFQVN